MTIGIMNSYNSPSNKSMSSWFCLRYQSTLRVSIMHYQLPHLLLSASAFPGQTD
ncbi:hypothetical protein L873DRAFT_1811381 [Choiromyces venosus 120613-1]|uniref:Uncharacterized protein n=1 Tax=Choiromyces venosus 120613-1 TaxID=1336337 RepID=A0A3N4JE19_9PEZI|nr:hypothetical protein L873DRAFT_1811381 [Choiromyces venosus 120613-1]